MRRAALCAATACLVVGATASTPPFDIKEYEWEVPCDIDSVDDCGPHGQCVPRDAPNSTQAVYYVCDCGDRHATPISVSTNGTFDRSAVCSVERKDQLTAVLLSAFLGGVGAGSFYMGWTAWGIIPFILCCGSCLCLCGTRMVPWPLIP